MNSKFNSNTFINLVKIKNTFQNEENTNNQI